MKKIYIPIIASLLLISCNEKEEEKSIIEKISFKQYVEIVNNQVLDKKDLFIFTSSTCFHCAKVLPLVEKYVLENNSGINIHLLSLDVSHDSTKGNYFNDETMGLFSGNSKEDAVKGLDNRITKMIVENHISEGVQEMIEGKYSYVSTPLFIWYENNIEIKLSNSIESLIEENDSLSYQKLVTLIEDFDIKYEWNEPFNLIYFENENS